MQLSAVLITHQLSDEAMEWFADVRSVADELVAFVDDDRAAPDVIPKLEKLRARILRAGTGAFYRFDFAQMVAACRGEWLLKIDYDEQLSPAWLQAGWRDEVLAAGEFTHFWSPRRWLVAPDRFVACEPWWPDWQLRLFRNSPHEITFPTRLHETMSMTGASGYLRSLAIHHHDVRTASRSAREEKAAAYERQRPGNGLGFFYLPEDFGVPLERIPTAGDYAPGEEILVMDRLDDEEARTLRLEVEQPPATMQPGDLAWIAATLHNGSSRTLRVGSPFPINLAYHWLRAGTSEPAVFDGERTALLPGVPPHGARTYRMFVTAPRQPGDYILRVTLVQEQLRWLDTGHPHLIRDFPVHVALS